MATWKVEEVFGSREQMLSGRKHSCDKLRYWKFMLGAECAASNHRLCAITLNKLSVMAILGEYFIDYEQLSLMRVLGK